MATPAATFSRLLSVREVAARLGVCTSTVYKLCNGGRLAHVRVSNAIRVEPSALEALGRRRGPREQSAIPEPPR